MAPTNRHDRMRIEMETERRIWLKIKALAEGELRDVEHRLKVFFAWEGDHG